MSFPASNARDSVGMPPCFSTPSPFEVHSSKGKINQIKGAIASRLEDIAIRLDAIAIT